MTLGPLSAAACPTADSTQASPIVTAADTLTVAPVADTGGGGRHSFIDSRMGRMTLTCAPLIVGGLLVKSEDDHFRSLRDDYPPHYDRRADDYLQYAPAAAMLVMKAAGAKGRSTWGRMLASDAFSALIMGGAVNTLKQTTHVVRPDGSNNRSFPSGHTATAFMTATMLTKEYGHLSPWVGIGAYSTATATGLMRMANNKHWLSDVLTGAGIGVLSTELGYGLADLIFGGQGASREEPSDTFDRLDRPSFVGLYLGMNVPLSGYDIDDGTSFDTSSGCTAGVEGAYFLSPYVGVGDRLTVSNTSIIVDGSVAADNTFNSGSLCGGVYFSYPLTSRWLVGGKVLGGYVHYSRLRLGGHTIGKRGGMSLGTGVSTTIRVRKNYGLRLFADYNLMPPHSKKSGEWMNNVTCGAAFDINL